MVYQTGPSILGINLMSLNKEDLNHWEFLGYWLLIGWECYQNYFHW